ncbi:hypothetical protein SAMN05421810_11486 [Amycolatopsis arida]|uniref:Nucleoside-diphosphate-sugar epimerase n=1 Tax=Amycolatopsis arida TaxID=587909 RepID=A0A1I6AT62_9PSEU|nr:hypothetical protein [Amycolatopsis arida]TDX97537.1 hypothetical protein CLV69_102641 [Amycolatopsis arida]SFQ71883.1 hypothetical protein SAMN05421810_11486 [Amycolatopsis arida]
MATENIVRAALGERAFVVRPGQITGPGDYMDRFGYWPARLSRGGRAIGPDAPDQPIQHVDVRDLAAWIVTAGKERIGGAFDAVGPTPRLGAVLRDMTDLVAGGTELVPVPLDTLVAAGVRPWSGPRSLPLWLPASRHGLVSHDATRSWDAGPRIRPLAETVHATLAEERARGLDRPRQAGLTPAEETELLRSAG